MSNRAIGRGSRFFFPSITRGIWAKLPSTAKAPRELWPLLCLIGVLLGLTACRQMVVVVPATSGAARAGYADAISNIAPCVVSVHTRTELTGDAAAALTNDPALRKLFKETEGDRPKHIPHALVGLGSGVVISPDGYILTSGHVIEGVDRIIVTTSTGEELRARVIGTDKPTDIAVLKVDSKNLPTARLADSSRLRVGDIVLALGNPFGVGQTVTSGIVSGTKRDGFGIADYEDFIQTDASINPGNSGGALVDAEGRVVGISIAILSSGGGFEGIGLAVPINLARNVMGQLIAKGKVVRGYLGVTLHPTLALNRSTRIPQVYGALVAQLAPNSPAQQAGMREEDVILECNGRPVADDHELRMSLAQMSPGTRLHLKVRRSGQTSMCKVTLGEIPWHTSEVEEDLPMGGSEP